MSFSRPGSLEQKTLDNDYSISTFDTYSVYLINANKTITIDLPPAANNYGKELLFKQLTNRRAIIDGNSSETIDGDLTVFLSGQYSYLKISCNGSNWNIKSYNDYIDSGWINRSDWTNVHIGTCEVDYDNLSGTPILGETVTCSGGIAPTGIIYDIIDGGGGTGTLKLMWVTNGGVFGDNLTLTFAISGATALVNESTYNKNVDTDIYHGYSKNLSNLKNRILISTDGTDNNSFEIGIGHIGFSGSGYGLTPYYIDSNNFKFQSGGSGMLYLIDSTGAQAGIAAQDWFYKIIIQNSINKG